MKIRLLLTTLAVVLINPVFAGADETEYLAVFLQGKKVGYAINTRTVTQDRVATTEEVSITISRVGAPVTIKMSETGIETKQGEPLGFEAVQDLGAMATKITGTVDKQGIVSLNMLAMGAEQKSTMEWPKGAVMAEGLRLLTAKHGLKEGTRYTAKMFSAGIMEAIDANVAVGPKQDIDLLGRVVKLTQVTTTLTMPGAGDIVMTSYVDDDLRALKSTMPIAGMEVELVSCAKEFALGENDVLELIERMFVKSPQSIDDVRSASSITYVLKPGRNIKLVVPNTDTQKVEVSADRTVTVTVTPAVAPSAAPFPYRGRDENLLEASKPTRFLQSNDKKLVALARRAVGDAKNSAEAVRQIEAFVARYMTNKGLSVGYASAAEVAESRAGDCTEFAVLTAAMCRAVGIPAQVVVGVAYVKDFAGIEGFGGHAWTQAYVGDDKGKGTWVGLDAAFKSAGLGGYDAGHLALAVGNGEPGAFFNMAAMLGNFTIEKLNVNSAL